MVASVWASGTVAVGVPKWHHDDHLGTTTAAHDAHEQSPLAKPDSPESWWSPSPCELANERFPGLQHRL